MMGMPTTDLFFISINLGVKISHWVWQIITMMVSRILLFAHMVCLIMSKALIADIIVTNISIFIPSQDIFLGEILGSVILGGGDYLATSTQVNFVNVSTTGGSALFLVMALVLSCMNTSFTSHNLLQTSVPPMPTLPTMSPLLSIPTPLPKVTMPPLHAILALPKLTFGERCHFAHGAAELRKQGP